MKTLVIFYSYSGNTKKLAEEVAGREAADIFEVREKNKPGKLGAYVAGSIAAMRRKKSDIEPITVSLAAYDKLIVMAPVWAGYPAPAINNVFDMLPSGKEVEVLMVSASGNSSAKDKVQALVKSKGCDVSYRDIKS